MAGTNERELICRALGHALSGQNSHVETGTIFQGLDWKLAGQRPDGVSHSLHQLANHMLYWQEWAVKWLDGKKPRVPKHAAGSWPGTVSPANRKEWERVVHRFCGALEVLEERSREADLLCKQGKLTRMEMLHLIASHNSYHAGQAAFLRQQLGAWPPPTGGVTW